MRSWVTPGTVTTMTASLPLPCTATSDSATPRPLTRCRMISTVCCNCSSLMLAPSSMGVGARITCVPPCRSSPSRGVLD